MDRPWKRQGAQPEALNEGSHKRAMVSLDCSLELEGLQTEAVLIFKEAHKAS